MKTKILSGLAIFAVILVLGVSAVCAASSVSFKDSYVEKVLAFREDGETWYEEYATGKFSATFKLDLSPIFPANKTDNMTKQFNADTCFDISVVAISESFCLGDGGDVKYTQGKASATVTRKEDIGEEREKWITYMTTTVKWTAKNVLTIKVSGKSDWVGWILADSYDGENNPTIEDVTSAVVTVSGTFTDKSGAELTTFQADSDITVTGKAITKIVHKGQGDDQEEFELTKVNLTGKGTPTVAHD